MPDKMHPEAPSEKNQETPALQPLQLPLGAPAELEELGNDGLVCDPATGVCYIPKNNPAKPQAWLNLIEEERFPLAVEIQIFSDYIWPFCYIGEGLVDKLQKEAGLDLDVTWLPFELHPDTPSQGVNIVEYLGYPPSQFEQMEAALRARAEELGLPLNGNRKLVNTHKALLLSEWAADHAPEQLPALHHALFQAYFVQAANLAEDEVLKAACSQVGIRADEALAGSQAPLYEERVAASMQRARAYGITGAPTFIIDNRYKIVGAQPYEVLLKALRQISAEQR